MGVDFPTDATLSDADGILTLVLSKFASIRKRLIRRYTAFGVLQWRGSAILIPLGGTRDTRMRGTLCTAEYAAVVDRFDKSV